MSDGSPYQPVGSNPYQQPGALNDVTRGDDASCSDSSLCGYGQVPDCTPAFTCAAQPGYDGPTGLGTPDGAAAFKPGPNLEVVQGNCGACHSADYIVTQPRGPAFKKAFWEAEVAKMINVYGAPIDPSEAQKIVEYLVQVY